MQRFHDNGPYSPDNCRKGTPKDNSKTAGACKRRDKANKAAESLELERVLAPLIASKDTYCMTEDEWEIIKATGLRASRASFLR